MEKLISPIHKIFLCKSLNAFLYKSQTIFVKIPKYICVVDKKTEGGGGAKGSSGTMWLFGND